ncbi:MAG: ATP-binding protein [Bacteroidales bacterium]|nr:ATP-binding protein [Bacteroidales bacterium]
MPVTIREMKIAIASGKGGTGKTMVSANLFYSLQNAGMKVSLVDCDAEEPNAAEFISGSSAGVSLVSQKLPVIDTEKCTFCGKCFEYCNYHAIVFLPPANFIQVVSDLCHDCGACVYACEYDAITEINKELGKVNTMQVNGQCRLIEGRVNVGVYSSVPVVKKAIQSLNCEDIAIYDSPPGISCPFIATVVRADYVVLVTEPTPFGLNDLKLSVATLEQLDKPYGVIVNKAGLGNREVYEWIAQKNIPLLMEIPFDKEIARIYSEGRLLAEVADGYQERFLVLSEKIKQACHE